MHEIKIRNKLTDAFEFLFEESHVVTVGDTEVIIRVVSLVYAVWWICSADGKDRG